MKDLLLIPVMLAAAALGIYIVRRVNRFMEESQREIAAETRNGQIKVRIAAENPMLLDQVAPALESCSGADPHIGFFLSSGKADLILEKLMAEQIDIVLLDKDSADMLGKQYASVRISCKSEDRTAAEMPPDDPENDRCLQLVWKKSARLKNRDRVIFAIENENGGMKYSCAH